jgi:hypothetical protein
LIKFQLKNPELIYLLFFLPVAVAFLIEDVQVDDQFGLWSSGFRSSWPISQREWHISIIVVVPVSVLFL